jgi:hypothetical protein
MGDFSLFACWSLNVRRAIKNSPLPFAVRTYTLPDLFAGKMYAILCRRWKNRGKIATGSRRGSMSQFAISSSGTKQVQKQD